jgi:O-antigen/teichoic acid export membrane protein
MSALTDSTRPELPEAPARPSRGSLAGGTVLNLAGSAAPLAAAVVAFPLLNRTLGTERVGFITLAWALIGYFGLFDLGLGRALTKLVAERSGTSNVATLPRLVWTALALMLGLAVVAASGMALSARWLVERALSIPPELQPEAIAAFRVLAAAVPFVVTAAGLRGVLEGQGRFFVVNAVRAPLGIWLIVAPLAVLPFGTRSLAWIAALMLLGRVVAWAAFAAASARGIPGLLLQRTLDRREIAPLLRFGGWMMVTNLVSPLMVYLDRFLVGSRVSLEAVAWYATPWEMVTKILVLPGAIVAVLFPIFSEMSTSRGAEATKLYGRSIRVVAALLFLPCFVVSLFAREGLSVWLGPDFASHAFRVAQLIALGALLNGVAHVPFAFVQGAGRPDLTARIHLFELPVYLGLVLWFTSVWGIMGTAIAWTLRVGIDLALMHVAAHGQLDRSSRAGLRALGSAAVALALLAATLRTWSWLGKASLLAGAVVLTAVETRPLVVALGPLRDLPQRFRGKIDLARR